MNSLYLILGGAALVLLWAVYTYNRFVSRSRYRDEAWSGVSVQLKQRHDLIPNLIETVKGYAAHEKGIFEEFARLRGAQAGGPPTAQGIAAAAATEGMLSQALGRLFALAEAYPELKANQGFLDLQQSLQEIEEKLEMARRYFNGTVREYNILVESFPSLIIARMFSFAVCPFFELDNQAEAVVPTVKF